MMPRVDKWETHDKVFATTYAGLIAVDYGQTVYALKPSSHRVEHNILIHDRASLNYEMGGCLYLTYLLADKFPKHRTIILILANMLEFGVTSSNKNDKCHWTLK